MGENWMEGVNFQLGIENIVRDGEGYSGRLRGSGKEVSIWKIPEALKEMAENFMISSDENLLKVYLVGPLKKKNGWYVVTEHVEDEFGHWSEVTDPKSVVEGEISKSLSRRRFVNPLASLIKSAIAIMTRYARDVSIDTGTPIYVVKRSNKMGVDEFELKFGFYQFGEVGNEEFLQGFVGILALVQSWLTYHDVFIPDFRDVFILRMLLTSLPSRNFWDRGDGTRNRFHRLSYILESPFFLFGMDKGRLWDRVTKMDNVERDVYSSTGQYAFYYDVMYMFRNVEAFCEPSHVVCGVIMQGTQWYFEDHSCPALKAWFEYNEYYVPNHATGQQSISPALTFNWIIRSLRNFWCHASEYANEPNDLAPKLAATIERMIPGIWAVMHYAIITSHYLHYFLGEVE